MTHAETRAAIEEALGTVDFPENQSPVDLCNYTTSLRQHLVPLLPGLSVEAYHRWKDIVVRVRAQDYSLDVSVVTKLP